MGVGLGHEGEQEVEGVADGAVDDEAAQALADRIADHDLAGDGIGEVAPGVHHDDVAGLGQLQRLVQHQVVTRPGPDGQRRACKVSRPMHRPHSCAERTDARHRIAHIGNGKASEGLDKSRLDAIPVQFDAKSVRHEYLKQKVRLGVQSSVRPAHCRRER